MISNSHSTRYVAPIAALIASVAAGGLFVSAQSSSPLLLVALRANKSMGALAFVDPSAGKIIGRVATGQDPHGVDVSADGKTAFVVNTSGPDGNSISVIDIAAMKEVRRIDLGPGSRPHDIHVANGKVYFTAQGYKAIGRHDPARNTMEWFGIGQQGPHMLAITSDGNTIFAANPNARNVAVIDMSAGKTDWKLTIIPTGREGEGIDISPDGREVWTANGETNGGISIIDVGTRKVIHTIPLEAVHTNRLQFAPDGKHVIVLDREASAIIVVDPSTRREIKRIKPEGAPGESIDVGDVLTAPDGSRAYVTVFSSTAGGRNYIAVIDLKTLAITSRIETPISADEMAWATLKH